MSDACDDRRIFAMQQPTTSTVLSEDARTRLHSEFTQFQEIYSQLMSRVLEKRENKREWLKEWNPSADKRVGGTTTQ